MWSFHENGFSGRIFNYEPPNDNQSPLSLFIFEEKPSSIDNQRTFITSLSILLIS